MIKLSVVMPVYNRKKYIEEAIDSVLNQTFQDFELIIIDDGSTDNTVSIIENYNDTRIKLIKHQVNKGVASARNTGYLAAQGEYIVITDSDDINLLTKFEEQVNFLDRNHEYDIVGCYYQHFESASGKLLRIEEFLENSNEIKASFLLWNRQAPASMFRREKIMNEGYFLHNESYTAAVDVEWFSKQPKGIKFTNIQKVLYLYRRHLNQFTLEKEDTPQKKWFHRSRLELLNKMGITVTNKESRLLKELASPNLSKLSNQSEMENFITKILYKNKLIEYFDDYYLKKLLLNHYIKYCYHHSLDPLYYALYKDIIKDLLTRGLFKFKSNTEIKKRMDGKSIAIFGTLDRAIKIFNKLNELRLPVKYLIDNLRNESTIPIPLYNQEILVEIPVDLVIISIESPSRLKIAEDLITNFPQIEILTLEDIFE